MKCYSVHSLSVFFYCVYDHLLVLWGRSALSCFGNFQNAMKAVFAGRHPHCTPRATNYDLIQLFDMTTVLVHSSDVVCDLPDNSFPPKHKGELEI